jgi:hypothetical protein
VPADPPTDNSDRPRRLHAAVGARRAFAILTAIGCICAAAGCSAVALAGQSSGNQQFVNDVATRLSAASTTAYTAEYALRGGGTGTIAQQPSTGRASYRYPTGVAVLTPAGATTCTAATSTRTASCSRTKAVAAASPKISRGGLVRPDAVVALLNTAALDRDSIIAEHDTTIAGTSATCVTVTSGQDGSEEYDACVTADGLLGSFRGSSDGASVDITMLTVTKSVSETVFALPAGAVMTD